MNELPDARHAAQSEPPVRDVSFRTVAGRIGRQSVAYTLASAVGPLTSVLLLPVYTRYLTPADYGLIALLEVLSLVFATVFSLGLTAMIPFYYVDFPAGRERRRGVGTVVVAVTLLNLALAALIIGVGAPAVRFALPSVAFWPYVPILALTALFDPYWIAIGAIYQIQERAFNYSAWSTARITLAVALKVVFVVVLAQGVYGYVFSGLLTAAITAVVTVPLLWREMEPALDRTELRRALTVGGPTVPNNLFTYGFRVLDRVLLDRFVDQGQIGLYYMALKIADVIKLGTDVFVNAWRPVFFKEAAGTRFRAETLPAVIRLASVGIIGGCLAISLFSREIIAVLAAPSYAAAAVYVPFVAGAMALKGIYAFPYLAVWYKKRTSWVPLLTVVTMVFSITANLLVMPRYGAMGAAVVVLASYLLLFVLMTRLAQHSFPIDYPWRAVMPAAIAAIICAAVGSPMAAGGAAMAAKLLLLTSYAAVVMLSGGVHRHELNLLFRSRIASPDAAIELR